MSRGVKQCCIAVLLLALGFTAWGRGVWLSGQLPQTAAYSLLYHEEQTLGEENFWQQKTAYDYAAVRQDWQVEVEAPQFRRTRSLTLLEVVGEPSLLLPVQEMLVGGFPLDSMGCAIDRESALLLWGDLDVVGKIVEYNDKEYTITGVFDSEQPMGIFRPPGEMKFRHLVFTPPQGEAFPRKSLDDFLTQEGISTADVVTNRGDHYKLFHQLSRLPALIPGSALLFVLLRGFFPEQKTIRRVSFLSILTLSGYVLGIRLWIPVEFLPTRWSDFSFWSSLVTGFQQDALSLHVAPGLLSDYLVTQNYTHPILALAAISTACFVIATALFFHLNRE